MQERLRRIFSSFGGSRHELIPLLQRVQDEFGYLGEESMLAVARFARVPESRVYAVATFYDQFRFTPSGRVRVKVCRGASCHVQGAPRILKAVEKQLGVKAGETTPDQEYSLETVSCIGACGLAPCIVTNNKIEGKMTPTRVTKSFRKAGQR